MTVEDNTRRLIVAAERLNDTAQGVRAWAATQLLGTLPEPLQRLVDAAESYEEQLTEHDSSTCDGKP